MATDRIIKINEAIRRTIAKLIVSESEDPRFKQTIVTITKVETSRDLRQAKVYFSVLDESLKHDTMRALKSAKPFFTARLKKEVVMRFIPNLSFHLDSSMKEADGVLKKISELEKRHKEDDGE